VLRGIQIVECGYAFGACAMGFRPRLLLMLVYDEEVNKTSSFDWGIVFCRCIELEKGRRKYGNLMIHGGEWYGRVGRMTLLFRDKGDANDMMMDEARSLHVAYLDDAHSLQTAIAFPILAELL